MRSVNAWSTFFAVLALTGLMGCSPQLNPPTMEGLKAVQAAATVENIQVVQRQTNYGSTVYLKGKVGKHVPLLTGIVYELQDSTGSIWVLTKGPVPKQGEEILIKGKLRYQKIQLDGKEQGSVYIEQQEQLQPTSS